MIKKHTNSTRRGGRSSTAVLRVALLASALCATDAFAAGQAQAQANSAAAEALPTADGDILVTARRKSENILTTPIAITAMTSADIESRGIRSLQDLGDFVPGLNIVGQATGGGARADRSFVGIVVRGMLPSTSAAQTTSIFIDGAPVSTASALQTLTNPERLELLKGPQSAQFGRQTFAGALNIVTKDPSDHLSGSFSGLVGTRANYDAQGEVSGPLIDDVLGFRASLRAFGKHGSYSNAGIPGQTLGDQSTKTGSLAILFTPTSNLRFRGFGLFSELKDGPSAQGVISGTALTDSSGRQVLVDQSNCTLTGSGGTVSRFMCGVAPGLSALSPGSNTANDAVITNFLNNPVGRVVAPADGPQGYGLVNHFYHLHFNADWKLGDSGVALSSLTAFNSELKSELADFDNYYSTGFPTVASATSSGYFNYPFLVEARQHDFSQEVRANFENGGPLHLTAGASYLNARGQTASGTPNLVGVRFAGVQQSKTYGIFGSVGYDITSALSLSTDGRYQIDKVSAFAGQGGVTATTATFVPVGVYPEGSLLVQQTYKTFLPRVIAQYKFGPDMVYASYSKGVNPGVFNTNFITQPAAVVAAAQALGFQIAVKPEKITNYEIGSKGKLFGGKLRYDTAAFFAIWTDQVQSQQQTIVTPSGPLVVVASANVGRVQIYGLEANLVADLARGLTLDLTGAYIQSKVLDGRNSTVSILTGVTDFRGKENPFTSKWSGNAGIEYEHPLRTGLDGFGRADFIYKSGTFSDIANIVRTPDMTQVNLRAGVRNSTFAIEGFVTNAFNNRAYYSITDASTVLPTGATAPALIAQLRELRTVGVRTSFKF